MDKVYAFVDIFTFLVDIPLGLWTKQRILWTKGTSVKKMDNKIREVFQLPPFGCSALSWGKVSTKPFPMKDLKRVIKKQFMQPSEAVVSHIDSAIDNLR